jgi:hypothetical protein
MFNHHFFGQRPAYERFLADSGTLAIVTDPPFGGRVELVDRCLKSIAADWDTMRKKPAKFEKKNPVAFMWIFPYFMESKITGNNAAFRGAIHQF